MFNIAARSFAAPEDWNVAVCLLPGTELCFADNVKRARIWPWSKNVIQHKTSIFRQVNLNNRIAHHDALEFPDGQIVLLTCLASGQQATVLQLPVAVVTPTARARRVPLPAAVVRPRTQPQARAAMLHRP
jgi:hypothetical protein